jgi:hypothetical protein
MNPSTHTTNRDETVLRAIILAGHGDYGGKTLLKPSNDDLSFRSSSTGGTPRFDALHPEPNIVQIREMLDHIKNNLARTQRRIERTERQSVSLSRQLTALWILVIMMIVGFGLLTWFQMLQRKP